MCIYVYARYMHYELLFIIYIQCSIFTVKYKLYAIYMCIYVYARYMHYILFIEQYPFRVAKTLWTVFTTLYGYCSMNSIRTGWRRLIGSPELQIIFYKRATKYRAPLLKMTYNDKGSYESLPPCSNSCIPKIYTL